MTIFFSQHLHQTPRQFCSALFWSSCISLTFKMNRFTPSQEERGNRAIAAHCNALRESEARQGQRPNLNSKEEAYSKFMLTLSSANEEPEHPIYFVCPSYPPCTKTQLERMYIADLRHCTHHRGSYLILRAVTPPKRIVGIRVLMEDDKGDAIQLQLNMQEDEERRVATNIVDVGRIILIKEPYFEVMENGEYALCVDHPSDIMHVHPDGRKVPREWQLKTVSVRQTAEIIKLKGNKAMSEARYWDALSQYTHALDQPAAAKEVEIIKRNRSLAYLKTKHFDTALLNVGYTSLNSKSAEKALFRAAEAL
ncbi:hypothetical protein BT63DRAFT_53662 [Microthyrium microscopicum]|uniref:TPR-like protein n=1 Tax=Microthyrium microscopicum TaxID=703497 RepID=A0A6A6U531_9PEZI|nr:hypothetical protein BT63DRAFT_53662 [Microthyrium microscopicum]